MFIQRRTKFLSTCTDLRYNAWLQATIDQVDGLMFFDGSLEQLLQWDSQIQGICNQLNVIVDNIVSKDIALQA